MDELGAEIKKVGLDNESEMRK